MERLEECISFLAGKAVQQVSRRARDKLAPHGVTPVQYAVLRALTESDGASGAELGARLVLDSASITGVIDRMEAQGLLERRPDAADRRVHRLHRTGKARRLEAALDAAMDELNEEAGRIMGPQGAALMQALARLGSPDNWSRNV